MEQFDGSFRLAGSRDSLNATFAVSHGALKVTAGDYEIGHWPLNQVRLTTAGDGIHILVEGEDLVVKMRDPGGFTEAVGEAAPPPVKKKRRLLGRDRPPKAESPPLPAAAASPPQPISAESDVSVSAVRLNREPQPAPEAAPMPTRLDDEPMYVPVQQPTPPKRPLSKRVREAKDIVEWKEWRARLGMPAVRWGLAFFGVLVFVSIAVFATGTLGMLLTLVGMVSLILAALAVSDDPSVYRFLPARITETMLLAVGFVSLGLGLPLIFLG